MEIVKVIRTGTTSDDRNWAQVEKQDAGFVLTAFINPVEIKKVGDEIKVPSRIAPTIKWEA